MNVENPPAAPPASAESDAFVPYQATRKQRLFALLIYGLARLLTSTMRFRWERDIGLLSQQGRPYIFCVWHNRLPLSLMMYRRFVETANAPFRLAALVSASRDGALMTKVLERFNVEPARGSSSRRGREALLELALWTERGYDIAFAPDGPRGPKYEMKPGIVVLAQMTGRAIVPASYHLNRKITLKSWDRLQIPLPFSTCVFSYSDPIRVPREFREEGREQIRAQIEVELRKLTKD
jgi:lysophospholipid acyltransferase (LPLAT)-like uncharacterized protein